MRLSVIIMSAVIACVGAACSVHGPYELPKSKTQTAYTSQPAGWAVARPDAISLSETWWTIYNDEVLNHLMTRLNCDNLSLQALWKRREQALETLQSVRAGLLPSVTGNASLTREQQSTYAAGGSQNITVYQGGLTATWEPDIWGQMRANVESARAAADIATTTLAAARLSLQATFVTTYFNRCALALGQNELDHIVALNEKLVTIAKQRLQAGIVSRDSVDGARSQLLNARMAAESNRQQRAAQDYALAILVGETPENFSLPIPKAIPKMVNLPVHLPSTLLERRPDVVQAERQVAQAFAQYGVAKSALFPALNMTASIGTLSRNVSDLFKNAQQIWSLGPAVSMPLFDFGQRAASSRAARAGWEAALLDYQQAVLAAFQDVETALTALTSLTKNYAHQRGVLDMVKDQEQVIQNQYDAGIVATDSLLQARAATSAARNNVLNLQAQLAEAHVGVIKSLGGGWHATATMTQSQ